MIERLVEPGRTFHSYTIAYPKRCQSFRYANLAYVVIQRDVSDEIYITTTATMKIRF